MASSFFGSASSATKNIIGLGGVMPSALTNLVNVKGNGYYITMKTIVDLFFRDWCVFMATPTLLFTKNKSALSTAGASLGNVFNSLIDTTGLPLVGFSFQQPSNYEILKYDYTKYPLLNRAVIANNMLKQTTKITLTGLRPITASNPVLLNYMMNTIGLKYYIEKYCDAGGTWWINTLWGARANYVLTELKGTKPVGEVGGVGWEFTFERLNFDSITTEMAKNDTKTSILEAMSSA